MYRPIQLTKTTSCVVTSRVTRPNDNKAIGNCFHALIAGLRTTSLILARRFVFPLLLLTAGLVLVHPCAGQSGTWTATGSLNTAREYHTATLLPDGKVLVAGGYDGNGFMLASAELYHPASGTWGATGSLHTERDFHTATLLPNGKVLVAGGFTFTSGFIASAELYDPATGTWTATGSLATAHYLHTATLLPNGKVLVAGGADSSGFLASAELYDPATGTWTATGTLATPRYFHTATLLPNGKVLVAGGYDAGGALASAELYDPASGTWTATGTLATPRYLHTATLLPNGKVLVAGGLDSNYITIASAELYDPASGTWTATGSLSTVRYGQTATLLPNGEVLVVGGVAHAGPLARAELYDPANGTWTATGSLITARCCTPSAILLPNGKVLVAGGFGRNSALLASAELYTPEETGNLTLLTAASRKTHGAKGDFDIDLPLAGDLGIECRTGLTRYAVVFTFNNNVTGADSATSGCGTVGSISVDPIDSHHLIVTFNGATCNEQNVTITATNVHDDLGNTLAAASASMGVLIGDINGDGHVGNGDIGNIQAHRGEMTSSTNFHDDVTIDGRINNQDVQTARSHRGESLP
jgi:WD40 repeat protein